MTTIEVDLLDEEETFSWDEYLKETNSESAPVNCFCQKEIPPRNEFRVGNKLETFDPRNTTSTCIGTVIEVSGSRIRLRLDGTDDRNDFWLMVDSDLIHPYGYTAKQNRKIQPPLGYGNDISKWPRFLDKIISTATTGDNVFAAESCFKPVPAKPVKNEFKVGHKLESVDPKNPHLICPATIKEIKRDKLLITFDGWSHSSDFWCSFTSRDLFPVGFCSKSGHILQFPGNLYDKKANTTTNQPINTSTANQVTSSPVMKLSPTIEKLKPKKTMCKTSPIIDNKKVKNETSSANSSLLNVTDTVNDSINPINVTTTPVATNTKITPTKTTDNSSVPFDLSLVKMEAIEPDEINNGHLKTVNLNSNVDLNSKPLVGKPKPTMNGVVYLIPTGDCGKYIKTDKFHAAHTKFGPGSPATVYKSILQSFIDCAVNRYEVFKMIPTGNSNDCIRLKNNNYNERKKISLIENINDMWSQIKTVCRVLEIDDSQIFSKTKIHTIIKKHSNAEKEAVVTNINKKDLEQQQTASNLPLTPQPSSSSSASSSSSLSSTSSSSETTTQNNNENQTEDTMSNKVTSKRRSTVASATNEEQNNDISSPCKVLKLDKSLASVKVSDWSIDQVVFYIYQLNDSNFSSYIEMFRHHEIDGKALLLLTTDILMKYMGFKLGPALKMNNYIEKLRKNLITSLLNYNQITPKVECNY